MSPPTSVDAEEVRPKQSEDKGLKILHMIGETVYLKKERLKRIIEEGLSTAKSKYPALDLETLPVALLSVIGGIADESFSFWGFLTKYLKNPKIIDDWIERISQSQDEDIVEEVDEHLVHVEDDSSSGVFIYPVPFLVTCVTGNSDGDKSKCDNDSDNGPVRVLTWLLLSRASDQWNGKHLDAFLTMASSKILEISRGSSYELHMDQLAGEWNTNADPVISTENSNSKIFPESICEDYLVVVRTLQSKTRNISSVTFCGSNILRADYIHHPFLDDEGDSVENSVEIEPIRERLEQTLRGSAKLCAKRVFEFEPNRDKESDCDKRFLKASDLVDLFESCVEMTNKLNLNIPTSEELCSSTRRLNLADQNNCGGRTPDLFRILDEAFEHMIPDLLDILSTNWRIHGFFLSSSDPDHKAKEYFEEFYENRYKADVRKKYRIKFVPPKQKHGPNINTVLLWNCFSSQLKQKLWESCRSSYETQKAVHVFMKEYVKNCDTFNVPQFKEAVDNEVEGMMKKHENDPQKVVDVLKKAISSMRGDQIMQCTTNYKSEMRIRQVWKRTRRSKPFGHVKEA